MPGFVLNTANAGMEEVNIPSVTAAVAWRRHLKRLVPAPGYQPDLIENVQIRMNTDSVFFCYVQAVGPPRSWGTALISNHSEYVNMSTLPPCAVAIVYMANHTTDSAGVVLRAACDFPGVHPRLFCGGV